ncbi:MAG TPA: OB-fold nucleic acid binding domain-containing protein [Clostridia bacterium]|nr:OB-fold nucleic acid binding domain-containing protein [Clostridia bacterium]
MFQIPLSELNEGDIFNDSFLLIKAITERTSQTGKLYCDITLADRDSEISAKLWEANKDGLKSGMVVKVRGTVQSWQNKLQLVIEKIRPVKPEDNIDYSVIVPTPPFDPADMYKEVCRYGDSIQDEGLKAIVKTILSEEKDRLFTAPAAKTNHHSERGGLLHHIFGVLKAAEAMCKLYDILNRDIMIAGAILHDICKLDEMDYNELGIVNDYTVEGNLIGHLVLGAIRIAKTAERLGVDSERALILEHIMITHHGEPELGAVRTPMFPEAEMLHHLDIIDARMYDYNKALKSIDKGQFSDWVRLLERRLYKHGLSKI